MRKGVEVWIFMSITALKRNQIHLYLNLYTKSCDKMNAEFYPHQIRAKFAFQRTISVKIRYEISRGQNRDLCGSYVGGIWA